MKLFVSEEGLLKGARFIPSPNCDERPPRCAIDLLVIHYISLPPGEFGGPDIEAFFMNRLDPARHPFYATIAGMKASPHFLLRRDGELIQFVPCSKRAWHAGESSWQGRTRCNDFSIGIEVEGTGETPFTDAQYARLAQLTRALRARYPIADIAGHSDIAPGRKTDPGPHFDWARYRAMVEVSCQGAKAAQNGKSAKRDRKRRKGKATPLTTHHTRLTALKAARPPRGQGKARKK